MSDSSCWDNWDPRSKYWESQNPLGIWNIEESSWTIWFKSSYITHVPALPKMCLLFLHFWAFTYTVPALRNIFPSTLSLPWKCFRYIFCWPSPPGMCPSFVFLLWFAVWRHKCDYFYCILSQSAICGYEPHPATENKLLRAGLRSLHMVGKLKLTWTRSLDKATNSYFQV